MFQKRNAISDTSGSVSIKTRPIIRSGPVGKETRSDHGYVTDSNTVGHMIGLMPSQTNIISVVVFSNRFKRCERVIGFHGFPL